MYGESVTLGDAGTADRKVKTVAVDVEANALHTENELTLETVQLLR
jgi:hypothetical protein